TASAIASGDLHERVPERPARTEVGTLSAAINAMLGQIQRAFADKASSEVDARAAEEAARESDVGMRRSVGDAGHELRPPLTPVRGFAELHRMGGAQDPGEAMAHIERESARMGVLVEDLLTLAALDAQRPLACEPVDLAVIADDAAAAARAVAPARTIGVEAPDAPVSVLGDAAR